MRAKRNAPLSDELLPGNQLRINPTDCRRAAALTALSSNLRFVSNTMALTKEEVLAALRSCVDPEIPVNIVDLGLVYEVDLVPVPESAVEMDVVVKMTLTSAGCPMSQNICHEVQRTLLAVPGVRQARVELVWEPCWSPDRISEQGRRHLQIA